MRKEETEREREIERKMRFSLLLGSTATPAGPCLLVVSAA